MAEISTGSDYLEWFIETDDYTAQEVLDYVSGLTFDDPEVRVVIIAPCNNQICVNGISHVFEGTAKEELKTALQPYAVNDQGNRVHCAMYYADKGLVEIEYSSHPFEEKPQNSRHTIEELRAMNVAAFDIWKTKVVAVYTEAAAPAATFSG